MVVAASKSSVCDVVAVGDLEPEEFFASVRREGRDAVITVEVDPEAPLPPDMAEAIRLLSEES